jgi:hypothetical protein
MDLAAHWQQAPRQPECVSLFNGRSKIFRAVHFRGILREKSFATWHEALDRYETLPVHKNSPRTWRAGHKELFAQMREYLTAAKKEYLANDTAEGLVQPMRAAFPSFDGDVLLHHPLRFLFPKS